MPRSPRRLLCVVMDGIGYRESSFGNAVQLARTPVLDQLKQEALYTTLNAHGTHVGLASDQDIGNSEVGHNALGAGRIFDQGAKLVANAIEDGSLFRSRTWNELIQRVKEPRSTRATLHLIGLLSDGNVHSHEGHLHAMLRQAQKSGVEKVRVHILLDGRDVPETSAEIYVERLERVMAELRSPQFDVLVASGGGRMLVTMDRYEADWRIVERGWNCHVHGISNDGGAFPTVSAALQHFRQDPSLTDQYLPEFVITDESGPVGKITDGDGVVFFNFRGDRAVEISRAFTDETFTAFDRGARPEVFFAGMMEYDGDSHIPPRYLVEPPTISGTLSETLLNHRLQQFACSETQKFGHVTFFWNGNRSGYLDESYEQYVEIPSDTDVTFDQRPQMKAQEIADATIEAMLGETFDFGRINFANGDMVGHTGVLPAAIAAVETVDSQVGRLVEAARRTSTILLVTADHGNCDEMFDAREADFPGWKMGDKVDLKPKTAHTLAPVPFYIFDSKGTGSLAVAEPGTGTLSHVANTALQLMGLPTCDEYLPSLLRGQH